MKKKRGQARVKQAAAGAAMEAAPMQPSAFIGGWSGYAGANWSEKRGLVHWPTMDSRQELDSWSRSELVRRIRFLVGNEGVLKGFVKNAPRFVGYLTPAPLSSDKEWIKEAKARFWDRCGNAAAFDVGGKFHYWTAQQMLLGTKFVDGDNLTALTETAGRRAQFAFYEAHQFKTPKQGGERWTDGVMVDAHGRHLAYGLSGEKGAVSVLSARDVFYMGDFERPGHPRAVPPLAHAPNHLLDRMEIRSNTKEQIKGASLTALARESDRPEGGKNTTGLPGVLRSTEAGNGGTYAQAVVGYSGQVVDFPPGVKGKILHDERPSPNQMEFMDSLVEDVALGFGLPPAVIYKMSKLTGPGVRMVLDLADAWIKQQQEELWKWCERVWVYTIAKEIKYGGLRMPKDGVWWRVGFKRGRSLTIDRSKEMKTRMEAVEGGYDTAENFCEEFFGMDADEVDDAHIARVQARMEKCKAAGVPYEVAYPPRQGAAVAAPVEDDEEETGKKGTE